MTLDASLACHDSTDTEGGSTFLLPTLPPESGEYRVGTRWGLPLESVFDASRADDATLVAFARTGDERAATAIWNRYATVVRALLRRSIGRQDVEDCVQEVFIRLYPGLEQLQKPSSLRSFIIGITLRVAGTELRRRRHRGWLTLTTDGDLDAMLSHATGVDGHGPIATIDGRGPIAHIDAREALERLNRILEHLSTGARLAFVLRYVEGMELVELAEALGVSLATAKRHLARASSRVFAMAERDPMLSAFLEGTGREQTDVPSDSTRRAAASAGPTAA